MASPSELTPYVRSLLKLGITEMEVRANLLSSGIPAETVESVIKDVQSERSQALDPTEEQMLLSLSLDLPSPTPVPIPQKETPKPVAKIELERRPRRTKTFRPPRPIRYRKAPPRRHFLDLLLSDGFFQALVILPALVWVVSTEFIKDELRSVRLPKFEEIFKTSSNVDRHIAQTQSPSPKNKGFRKKSTAHPIKRPKKQTF